VFGRVTDTNAASAIGRWEPAAAAPALFSGRCRAAAVPHGMRALLCPDPWSVLDYPRPRIALDSTATRLRTTNLHKVRWPNITLPGVACGATRPIELRDGRAVARSALEPWWDGIDVSIEHVSYGDIDGDGQDEAALEVICSNGGETADGQLRFASILFGADGHVLRPAGVITARRPVSRGVHVPLVGAVRIRRGRVVAHEWWYGERDATCCPSGRATTHWTYVDGRLRSGLTTITCAPRR
jgi:hypothetical protein